MRCRGTEEATAEPRLARNGAERSFPGRVLYHQGPGQAQRDGRNPIIIGLGCCLLLLASGVDGRRDRLDTAGHGSRLKLTP